MAINKFGPPQVFVEEERKNKEPNYSKGKSKFARKSNRTSVQLKSIG